MQFIYVDNLARNVRSWHRADILTELEVRYERGADVEFLVKLTGKRPDTLW